MIAHRLPRIPHRRFLFVAFVASLLSVSLIRFVFSDDGLAKLESSNSEELITSLIEQLGSENFRVRSNALSTLERVGLPAFQQLRKALDHSNVQIALSAKYLLLSQNVVWWLETDSHEVREQLQDYSALEPLDRHTRLGELARISSDDAFQALCRIAKFENNEWISRAAALNLLDKVCKLETQRQAAIGRSILLTIDQSDRFATRWLTTFARQSLSGNIIDFQVWTGYADELVKELSGQTLPRNEQRAQVLQFYEWLTHWAGDFIEHNELLELLKPSLRLVEANAFAVREYGNWALSVGLPELVAEIASIQPGVFENDPELNYLLAESYLKSENKQRANELAEQALMRPNLSPRMRGAGDIELRQRVVQGNRLALRGLFQWAEAEYLEALKVASDDIPSVQPIVANFYWEGGQYAQAADVLEPAIDTEPADANLPGAYYDYPSVVALYHWYRAMQYSDEHRNDDAMAQFRKALEASKSASAPNPDILIALHKTAQSEADRELFQTEFDAMVSSFRANIASEETRLAQSNLGQFANAGEKLASCCNQLAWLLSNCNTNVDEALYLSRRSLENYPDEPAFLDTMAQCCFAADRLDDAIRYQRQAVKKSPHDRLMNKQLAKFEAAKLQSSAEGGQ